MLKYINIFNKKNTIFIPHKMPTVYLSPEWLVNAWFGCKKMSILPKITFRGNQLSVMAYPKSGSIFRTMHTNVRSDCCFTMEVHDALRAFVKKISMFSECKWTFKDESLTITIESPTSMIHYTFPRILMSEEDVIPCDNDDIQMTVCSRDWFEMWKTMPPKGLLIISCSKRSKAISLNHKKGRWKAAIFGKCKPNRDAEITIMVDDVASVFSDIPNATFTDIIFKKIGPLQIHSECIDIFIAPYD